MPGYMQRSPKVLVRAAKTDTKPAFQPSSAKDAIERGTLVFRDEKDYNEAIRLYKAAMALRPNDDEARAALYNMGCAYAKQKQWGPAAEAVVKAINSYNLKLAVALKDDDLAELRDRREWFDALTEVKGGISRQTKVDLRSEAKAPFRLPRIFLFGGLGIGAAAGLFIISLRLVKALQGGEDAPEVQETLQNLGINLAAVAVLGYLVWRDVGQKKKSLTVVEREEKLSGLQLDLGGDRQLPLVRFRGMLRPVIIAGSKSFVERAIREARLCEEELRMRGVSVVPIFTDMPDDIAPGQYAKVEEPEAKILALKREFQAKEASTKGFGASASAAAKLSSEAEAVAAAASSSTAKTTDSPVLESDKKWRLTPFNTAEWKAWINEQREYANLGGPLGGDLYIQVQLDGTVRSSGLGVPPWRKFIDDLPSLQSIRTTFTDGIGPNI